MRSNSYQQQWGDQFARLTERENTRVIVVVLSVPFLFPGRDNEPHVSVRGNDTRLPNGTEQRIFSLTLQIQFTFPICRLLQSSFTSARDVGKYNSQKNMRRKACFNLISIKFPSTGVTLITTDCCRLEMVTTTPLKEENRSGLTFSMYNFNY